eukprot:CAMPEP_0175071580 /NCGR_PEP_ID=MMETSP0052_2-20121109/19321_1 /TAXON_ID=51329 ORGANISM="Polytomella parva, Strain SAG 63-3" /NCGR_SAMPLE_ID=MMETSP0052_2 /ASSEMBLY_ACC=CAM_ASM_000194 /LENGTH=119 /DNA_ID=CAMNT_0016338765 /DNA_START=591 /DNA_END=948 /DNA_ORIENTATION=-
MTSIIIMTSSMAFLTTITITTPAHPTTVKLNKAAPDLSLSTSDASLLEDPLWTKGAEVEARWGEERETESEGMSMGQDDEEDEDEEVKGVKGVKGVMGGLTEGERDLSTADGGGSRGSA